MLFFSSLKKKRTIKWPSVSLGIRIPHATAVKTACYLLYGCLFCSIFLGIRIAEQQAVPTIRAALKNIRPVIVDAGTIQVSFIPPRLSINTLTIRDKRTRAALYAIKHVVVTPTFASLPSGSIGVEISGKAYEGSIAVQAASGSLFDFSTAAISATIANQSLGAIPAITAFDKNARGKATVSATYKGLTRDIKKGTGSLTFSGQNIQVRNPIPALKIPSFKNVAFNGSMKFSGVTCDINKLKLTSKKIRSSFKGSATLNTHNIAKTTLALSSKLFIPHTDLVTSLFDKRAIARLKNGRDVYVSIQGEARSPNIELDFDKR